MQDYSFKEESKKMLHLLKYTRQWKQNVGAAIFFYVLGVFLITLGGFNTALGGMYMVIGGGMLVQNYEQIFFTSYMNTSAKHRYYSVNMFSIFTMVSYTIGYVMALIGIAVRQMLINREWDEHIEYVITNMNMGMKSGAVLLFVGIMGLIIAIYYGVASKLYLSSMIVFIIVFFAIYILMINLTTADNFNETILAFGIRWKQLNISFGKGAVIGYLILLAGIAISWLLRRTLYDRQYSPMYKKMFLRLSK
ncbi:MAG: hypothetical protein IJ661_08415 [Lachnospiraceae bacterium]|nr:hypothetical protein [Lachnospiraceae bacterium]